MPPDPRPLTNDQASWLRAAGVRFRSLWLAKLLGISAGMTLFFAAYFWLLRHPLRPPVLMPLTAIDRGVPFQPAALPLYLSLWLYVSLAPGLAATAAQFKAWCVAAVSLAATGLGLFYLFPTAVPPATETWAADSAFAFLKQADASGNACPSLHVAFAVFTAGVFARHLRELRAGAAARGLNWVWCAGIAYSTLATRQHVWLDVVAGAALGAIFGLLPCPPARPATPAAE
jgi:membrane-associated phospholipid phosphatase